MPTSLATTAQLARDGLARRGLFHVGSLPFSSGPIQQLGVDLADQREVLLVFGHGSKPGARELGKGE